MMQKHAFIKNNISIGKVSQKYKTSTLRCLPKCLFIVDYLDTDTIEIPFCQETNNFQGKNNSKQNLARYYYPYEDKWYQPT